MVLCGTTIPLSFLGISIFLLLLIPSATPLSFKFPSSDLSTSDLIQDGNVSISSDVIDLTTNKRDANITSSYGRVRYKHPVRLWDNKTGILTDFTTNLSFTINSMNNPNSGDGIAFFLVPNGSTFPGYPSGEHLGVFGYNETENRVIAVEFDTYQNSAAGDPDYPHVGIDINSTRSVNTAPLPSGIKYANKTNALISYNSSTKRLSVFCTYADISIYNENSSLSYDVDLRNFLPEWVTVGISASTGSFAELHQIHSWEFNSSLEIKESNSTVENGGPDMNMGEAKKTNKTVLVIGLVVGLGTLIGLGGVWFIIWMKRKRAGMKEEDDDDMELDDPMDVEFGKGVGPKRFSYGDLVRATCNFVEEQKLGQGGFGGVYRGFLSDLNLEVAIKKVSEGSKQGIKEYMSEVKIISQLRHKNLVQLIGWCHQRNELLLIYEFMPNGSLDSHLFGQKHSLSWEIRYKIALGLASALFYLHEEWEQCVVHRDIKSSNVMLDSNFNAKLGDFGLARLVDHGQGSQTTVLAGTMGYMAPECVLTGKSSKESDVYSYGVVALEIACGRKPVEPCLEASKARMVEWVWELYGRGKLLEAADSRLVNMGFDEKEMECLMVVGLWCVHPDCNLRPSIKQVIQALGFEAPLPILPPRMPVPTYYAPPLNAYDLSTSFSGGVSSSTTSSTASLLYTH